jgi:hypothetical protein
LNGPGQVVDKVNDCLKRLQAEWAETIGEDRFAVFIDALRELSGEHPGCFT